MSSYPTSFILLCMLCATFSLLGVIHRRQVFELPFLAATFCLSWLVPQGLAIESQSYSATTQDELFWLYVTSCLGLMFAGFYAGKRWANSRPRSEYRFDPMRLLTGVLVLLGIGLFSQVYIGINSTDQDTGQWTGVITAFFQLTNLRTYAIGIAVLAYVKTRDRVFLGIAIAGIVIALPGLFTSFKRVFIFDTIMASGGAYLLARRIVPSRVVILGFIAAGTILVSQIGLLRAAIADGATPIEAVMSMSLLDTYKFVNEEQTLELRQAKSDFNYLESTGNHTFIAPYWNQIVHQYVPSFLMGREFKEGLKVESVQTLASERQDNLFFSIGATRTGFSDSFEAFRYFGALVFGLIGLMMGWIFARAWAGNLPHQFYYLILVSQCLLAITHSTAAMLASLPFLFLTVPVVLWYARTGHVRRPFFPHRNRVAQRRLAMQVRQQRSAPFIPRTRA